MMSWNNETYVTSGFNLSVYVKYEYLLIQVFNRLIIMYESVCTELESILKCLRVCILNADSLLLLLFIAGSSKTLVSRSIASSFIILGSIG